jgi:preprotein translocase subunit YajC
MTRPAAGPWAGRWAVSSPARRKLKSSVCRVQARFLQRVLIVFISSAFAQSAPAAAGGGAESTLLSLLPLVLMFVVLYFIMIRPQMKRQKEHKAMLDALAKGDEVVVGGGVIGRISKLGDSLVHVEVAEGVEIQVQRPAIVQVLPKGTFK